MQYILLNNMITNQVQIHHTMVFSTNDSDDRLSFLSSRPNAIYRIVEPHLSPCVVYPYYDHSRLPYASD